MRIKKKSILLSSILLASSMQLYASNFNSSVIFGDSLSDGGNVGIATLGQLTKFTTNPGMTTAEIVADQFGGMTTPSILGGQNYALWGATVTDIEKKVPNLKQQLAQYLSNNSGQANANTLYQVWGGGNDIFNLVTEYQTGVINLQQLQMNLLGAANEEISLLNDLKKAGGKNVIVYNLPDMGLTPDAQKSGALAVGLMSQLSNVYNMQLNSGLNELSQSGLNIVPINVYGLLGEITENPHQYAINHLVDTACNGSSLGCTANGQGYMFADGVHPTSQTHQLLSQVVLSTLVAPQQISLLAELPLLSNDVQKRSIRQEVLNTENDEVIRAFATIDYSKQKIDETTSNPSVNSRNLNLNIGLASQLNSQLSGGVALSLNQQDGSFGKSSGDYDLQTINGILFALYQHNQSYFNAYINAGRLKFDDINRNVLIGPTLRKHQADTKGTQYGMSFELGHLIAVNSKVNIEPFLGGDWQKVKVQGFSENENTSTAMWFDDQKRESLISNIGVRIKGSFQFKDHVITPTVKASWNHEFKDEALTVKAGSKTMHGNFVMQGYQPEKNWLNLNVALNTQLNSNISSWVMFNSMLLNDSKNNYGASVGVKYQF